MKFLCSHCKAKYQIADEKVAGRTLRMVCRRCQQEIVIRGEPAAASQPQHVQMQPHNLPRAIDYGAPIMAPPPAAMAPAPSPRGADFHRQIAGNLASPLPAVAGFDEWHVAINDTPVGPMRRDEVARKLSIGAVTGDSLAWREGMDDWMPLLQIPELAMLLMPRAQVAPPVPPQQFVQPAQRMEYSPLGGRAGASPYTLDSWQPAPSWAPAEQSQQIAVGSMGVSPVVEVESERRAQGPSWPAMFTLAGGFALLMSALTIVGAGWLRNDPQAAAPAQPLAAGAAAPAPVQPAAPAPSTAVDPEPEGMVIGLEEVAGGTRPSTKPRTGSAPKTGGKKELTAAQKEMLARMGGEGGPDLSGLGTGSAAGSKPRATGSLTAAEMSQVVNRGKKNLQRCYETALRGSGSSETVRLDVELTVSAAGNVTEVKTTGQGLPGMNTCIERTVKMWRFPASGEAAATRFPLLFQPGA